MNEGELGAFIRSRREATTPESVGLPVGSRRRTPGLRRAELATLAGVSVDYLIRIEQGRDTNPSAQVVAALAEVMGLNDDEMDHLRRLAIVSSGSELCPGLRPAARVVRPAVHALLDQLDPTPAVVVNHIGDLLAWTDGFERLMGPIGLLEPEQPNLLAFAFTDERSRTAYPDWHDVAAGLVGDLRAAHRGPEDEAQALADHLLAQGDPTFASLWADPPLAARRSGVMAVAHPEVGVLRLAFESLDLADPDRQTLLVHLPADEATATGLDRLNGRQPGTLHSVATA